MSDFLLRPIVWRLVCYPLLAAETVAQFVFHQQDIVTVLAGVLLSVCAIRWALYSAAERTAGGGER